VIPLEPTPKVKVASLIEVWRTTLALRFYRGRLP
jgi:hypothetical protein